MKNAVWESWDLLCVQYKNGRINSERTMQALLFRFLQDALPYCNVFCEPSLEIAQMRAVPDVLVEEAGRITAAIELKFVPHGYPVFEDDLKKLVYYAEYKDTFPLALEPSTGKWRSSRFQFADDCLLVFGVIGRNDAKAVDESFLKASIPAHLADRFVPLALRVGGGDAA